MNQADYRDRTARLMHVILTCSEEVGDDGLCDCARSILEELCTAHANGLSELYTPIGHAFSSPGRADNVSDLMIYIHKRVKELDPHRPERLAAEKEMEEEDEA